MIETWGISDFDQAAYGGRWIPWAELERALTPGRRLLPGDAGYELRHDALFWPGIYLVAYSPSGRTPRGAPHPGNNAVQYIGKTSLLLRRLTQFANSAAFWGARGPGHYAGYYWNWPADHAFFGLFPVPRDVSDAGIESLWRICAEAKALAAYARRHADHCPPLNKDGAKKEGDS